MWYFGVWRSCVGRKEDGRRLGAATFSRERNEEEINYIIGASLDSSILRLVEFFKLIAAHRAYVSHVRTVENS